MTAASPFTDPAVRPALYRDARRLATRTQALHRSKVAGRPVNEVIATYAAALTGHIHAPAIADAGCGRGSSTAALCERLPRARLCGIDASAALLHSARLRLPGHAASIRWICADFHHLPLEDSSADLIVAAFCLYHSMHPQAVIAEFARCLAPSGQAILVTKSRDSYKSLDALVASSGLDPAAQSQPGLYDTAHSGNIAELAATALKLRHVESEEHQFVFADLSHVAEYLATSPKYELPPVLRNNPSGIAHMLKTSGGDRAITTASTVTYVVGSMA
jgi:ubiquinone/menaquinone biosynthesis C-methylase UbiE